MPHGIALPIFPDALFDQQADLWNMYRAYTMDRRVLFVGEQSAYGALFLYSHGAASVDGLIASPRVRKFARRHYAREGIVEYPDAPRGLYDILIGTNDESLLAPDGKILHDDGRIETADPKWHEPKLHVGSGGVTLPGWINIDNQRCDGIDVLLDVSQGLPFTNARFIFAEHLLEHLTFSQARVFLASCRAALREDGILRLSTPNLDWVWHLQYRPHAWTGPQDAMRDCFELNRSFRAWGHQFLYNYPALESLLHASGFARVRRFDYGVSDTPELAGLERHERYDDSPELPHVIVVEASGRREPAPLDAAAEQFEQDFRIR
ncbi:MAG: class I SAM-dependent methyltransferase [Thermoanaerobaculia bacterium]